MALIILSSCGMMISDPTGDSTFHQYDNQTITSHTNKLANKRLIIYNNNSGNIIKEFPISSDVDSHFSIEFTHSVNMSPVIDYYKINDKNEIYVYKTIYYNYGAGVESELENNEKLRYGNDGSMIIENIDKKIDPLLYYLSNVYDHKLRINDGETISLWDTCGKNIVIRIEIK